MKRLYYYLMVFACLMGTAVVTSCGSDDDEEEATLSELEFVNDAALYDVDSNDKKISYVELTTAGNYFIEYKTVVKKAKTLTVNDVEIPLPFAQYADVTRAAKDNFEYGTYTKNEDGSYNCKEFGTVAIEQQSTGKFKIIVTNTKGETFSLTATQVFNKSAMVSATARQICRSWKLKEISYRMDMDLLGTKVSFNEKASNYNDLIEKMKKGLAGSVGGEYGSVSDLDYVSFNTTGSYVVKTESSIDRGYWNLNNNKLYFGTNSAVGFDVKISGKDMYLNYEMKIESEVGYTSTAIGYIFTERLVK